MINVLIFTFLLLLLMLLLLFYTSGLIFYVLKTGIMKCVDFPYSFFLLAIYFYAIDSSYSFSLKKILISPIFF